MDEKQRSKLIKQEIKKLSDLLDFLPDAEKGLISGLIEEVAFLRVDNMALKEVMRQTGSVAISEVNPNRQKTTEAAKQYLRNVNTYSGALKTIETIIRRSPGEEDDDEFKEFYKKIQKDREQRRQAIQGMYDE